MNLPKEPKFYFYGFRKGLLPNLGVGHITATLRQHGFNWDYVYLEPYDDIDQAAKEICKLRPDILGFTSTSLTFSQVKALSEKVKQDYNPIILLGGAHIMSLPRTMPPHIDIGFTGEAEESVVEVISLIAETENWRDELHKIPGILFYDKNSNHLHMTPNRPSDKNLDTIPHAARDIYSKKYWADGLTGIITSRGCPYNCSFCQAKILMQTNRYHSAEYVVQDIVELHQKYGIHTINIADDLFIARRKRIREITSGLKKLGLLGKIKFGFNGRANLIDDEIVEMLIELGAVEVALGLESMSPRVLSLLKDKVTVEDNMRAVDTLHKHGLSAGGLFMVGSPTEGIEDIETTYTYIKNNIHKFGGFILCVTTPLPRTRLWDICVDLKRVDPDLDKFNWDTLDMNPEEALQQSINIYVGEVERKRFYKLYTYFLKLTTNNIELRKSHLRLIRSVGDSDAFYDYCIKASNRSMHGVFGEVKLIESKLGWHYRVTGKARFRMVGLFNTLTITYGTQTEGGPVSEVAEVVIDENRFILHGTENKTTEQKLQLTGDKTQTPYNLVRGFKNVIINKLSNACELYIDRIETEYLASPDNYILPNVNDQMHLQFCPYPVENWNEKGHVFWTNGEVKGQLRPVGKESIFAIECFSGHGKSKYMIDVELIDVQKNEIVLKEVVFVEPAKWHNLEFKMLAGQSKAGQLFLSKLSDYMQKPSKKTNRYQSFRRRVSEYLKARVLQHDMNSNILKFVIRSDTFIPYDLGINTDPRTLGIAIKSIRLK